MKKTNRLIASVSAIALTSMVLVGCSNSEKDSEVGRVDTATKAPVPTATATATEEESVTTGTEVIEGTDGTATETVVVSSEVATN